MIKKISLSCFYLSLLRNNIVMYKIELGDGSIKWFNERIIMKIIPNGDGTFTLEHFNNSKIVIKSFLKI